MLEAGKTEFYDPVLKKCTACPSSEPKCRKKVTVNRYFSYFHSTSLDLDEPVTNLKYLHTGYSLE